MKSKNKSLINKITLLDLDLVSLNDKLSSSLHEVDDLKYTLVKFIKGKNTLDTMLGMKVNFQREGLNYTPPTKVTPQKSMNTSHVSKPSTSKYAHILQKVTPLKFKQYIVSYTLKKLHVNRNSKARIMPKIV